MRGWSQVGSIQCDIGPSRVPSITARTEQHLSPSPVEEENAMPTPMPPRQPILKLGTWCSIHTPSIAQPVMPCKSPQRRQPRAQSQPPSRLRAPAVAGVGCSIKNLQQRYLRVHVMRRRVPDATVSRTLVAVGGEACPTGGRQKQSSKRQGRAGQGRAG